LGSAFKQQTGVSLMTYILNARLEHAASALRNTDVGVAELASRLGYASTSYFIQVFRTKYRMTPGDYRRASCV
jgi:two-component system response regulator YesN